MASQAVYAAGRLNSRSLLEVAGLDARNLLQGLITNDMTRVGDAAPTMAAAMLNAKGRVLADVIITQLRPEEGSEGEAFVLDLPASALEQVQKHLKIYKLRSKATITHRSDWAVHAIVMPPDAPAPDAAQVAATLGCEEAPIALHPDPRLPAMGLRCIVPTAGPGAAPGAALAEDDYRLLRTLHGVAEGDEISGAIPLEAGMELLGGVCFHKGCYLGQELVARTHFKGLVRKRVMPLLLGSRDDETAVGPLRAADLVDPRTGLVDIGAVADSAAEIAAVLPGDGIGPSDARRVGKVLGVVQGTRIALGLVRLEQAFPDAEAPGRPAPLDVRREDAEVPATARPLLPLWWPAPSETDEGDRAGSRDDDGDDAEGRHREDA